jgi:Cu(I)/Ag(I) efflux system membrane fusion protein
MKFKMKDILIIVAALIVGLAGGYLIFGNSEKANTAPQESHDHEAESMQTDQGEEVWTCSMHPQIRQNESGQCPICGMDLILLESNSSSDPLVLEMTNEAVKLANIQTTTVGDETSLSGKTIRLSGKVQADERLASSQVAHVPGRIEKLFVTFTGEQVRKGQKVATLYSPELITAQRELFEAIKLQDLNPGLLEAARNKLRFWKIGNATIDSIEQNGSIQETFTLHADESGVVTNRRVAIGDYLKKGEPLFDLMNLRKVWVLFDAYEENLSTISVGDRIEFTTPSVPNKTFKTRVTFIDPVLNPNTRVASLRTEVGNSNGLLKPEMFVNGTLENKNISKAQLTVPKSAILWTGRRSVVYVKVPDRVIPSFQFREVELGEGLGDSYQIISGLELGEEIVTNGSFTIDAAAQLNNQASMMNRSVKVKDSGTPSIPDYSKETPSVFKQQLNELAIQYLALKDGFVATNIDSTTRVAGDFLKALKNVDMSLIKGDAHLYWMEQLDVLKSHGQEIVEIPDIEDQRRQFSFLSDALINAIQSFGVEGTNLYIQYCPMAFNNEGADWISDEEQIRNPYFGDKMMKCGTVTGQLPATIEQLEP